MRRTLSSITSMHTLFQFTHPGKGATVWRRSKTPSSNVSIHAPWEGCDSSTTISSGIPLGFNSRTLGRVRLTMVSMSLLVVEFQFTHPGKGATCICTRTPSFRLVSIHAPWEGCDSGFFLSTTPGGCFNSRTLGRVRLRVGGSHRRYDKFQFTHPGKGATRS